MYGYETSSKKETAEAFETSSSDTIRNEEVLDSVREKRRIWKNLKRRTKIIGHKLRTGGFHRDVLESEIRKIIGLEYFPK